MRKIIPAIGAILTLFSCSPRIAESTAGAPAPTTSPAANVEPVSGTPTNAGQTETTQSAQTTGGNTQPKEFKMEK